MKHNIFTRDLRRLTVKKNRTIVQMRHLLFFMLLLLFFQGCASKYTVPSSAYPDYEGEVNQHSRLIKAENQRIFHILTHEKSFKTVCPKGIIVTYATLPPYQVGTIVNTKIDHIFDLEWRSQVMAMIPNKRIRLQFLDGFFRQGTEIWNLEHEGEFTKTTHTIIIEVNGFFKKMAWRLKVRPKHDKMVEAFLDNLKLLSETDSTN
jgi:hypothetical protein